MSSDEFMVVYSETPVKEIWSRLGYFENEHNAKEFLSEKNKNLTEEQLVDIAKRLSFSMRSAKEYYQSATSVSLLTKPLLIFYGMVSLSKALFTATYMKRSPSTGHGLESPKDNFENSFGDLSTKVKKDGAFPQFHCCYSKQTLCDMEFTLKELLSIICEIKVEYESVYKEKSQTIRIKKSRRGLQLVDPEFKKYGDLSQRLSSLKLGRMQFSLTGSGVIFYNVSERFPKVRSLSGEEFFVLPLRKHNSDILFPEMSAHYLIMYLLGMASRYYPKEWGEITEGKTSGDIYIIKKFLEVTERKFPNLILNSLRNGEFVFVSPKLEEEQRIKDSELERIYEYVREKESRELRSAGIF